MTQCDRPAFLLSPISYEDEVSNIFARTCYGSYYRAFVWGGAHLSYICQNLRFILVPSKYSRLNLMQLPKSVKQRRIYSSAQIDSKCDCNPENQSCGENESMNDIFHNLSCLILKLV